MRNPMLLLQVTAAVVVTTLMVASSPSVVQGMVTEEDCKCFMCVCDLDPHPLPPDVPATHHAPPVVVAASPPPPSSPPPATVVVVPATTYYPPPAGAGYYYPPQPYGYPWPTTSSYGYGPPAGQMYPRETKSGAPPRHGGGCGLLAVALASSGVLALLVRVA